MPMRMGRICWGMGIRVAARQGRLALPWTPCPTMGIERALRWLILTSARPGCQGR